MKPTNSIPLVLSPAVRKFLQDQQKTQAYTQARKLAPASEDDWGQGDMVIGQGPSDPLSKAKAKKALDKIAPPKAPPGKVNLNIDGVGKVEVDDTFLKLSPQLQQLTVNEIAAQTKAMVRPPVRQNAPVVSDQYWGKGDPIVGQRWQDDPVVGQPQKRLTPLDKLKAAGSSALRKADDFVRGAADTLTFGLADEIAAGMGSLTGIGGEKGNYATNVAVERQRDRQASGYRTAGQIGGALMVRAPAALVKTPGRLLASSTAGGAAYGFGSGEGGVSDRLDDAAIGAGVGLVAGHLANKLPQATKAVGKVISDKLDAAMPSRFASKQIADNPHAAVEAQVAQRIARIIQGTPTEIAGQKLSKAVQVRSIAKRVNDLEKSLLPTNKQLKALGVPTHEIDNLQSAITHRHILDPEDIQTLRGSPHGDLVADAIEEARALRRLVPEGLSANPKALTGSLLGELLDYGATGAGAALGGAPGSIMGRLASTGLRAVGRSLTPDSGGEALRAYKAIEASQPGYAKVLETLSPDAIPEAPTKRLSALAQDAFQSRQTQAEEALATRAANRAIGVRNDLDNIKPHGGFRGLVYDQTGLLPEAQDQGLLRMVKDGVITPKQMQQALQSPEKLMNGKGGLAIADRLAALADAGHLPRDPQWTPAEVVDLTKQGIPIRNPEAYRAAAQGNQARVTETLKAVQSLRDIDPVSRETLASAVQRIGSTSSRDEAEKIIQAALENLPDQETVTMASSLLTPLLKAYRP